MGVVYLGDEHFTCRVVKPNGTLWYHDGILTGSTARYDGLLHALPPPFISSCNIDGDIKETVGVLYVRTG
jgi:hypothetical protein